MTTIIDDEQAIAALDVAESRSDWRAPGAALLLRSDGRRIPLPDESVDLIFTSFPYFRLRSYLDDGEHYAGQIGDEDTWQEYLEHLFACTAEMQRVVRRTGSIFINEGDKMAERGGPGRNASDEDEGRLPTRRKLDRPNRINPDGIRTKSLFGLPWRYALGCIDGLTERTIPTWRCPDGQSIGGALILRAEIIWDKHNPMPESARDRVRRTHEQVFHFTVRDRYYAAIDEIREAHTGGSHPSGPNATPESWTSGNGDAHRAGATVLEMFDPRGRVPGSVWKINSEPLDVPDWLGVDHYAAFPQELARRIILGWSPPAICLECGEGRWPATRVEQVPYRVSSGAVKKIKRQQLDDIRDDNGFNAPGYPQTAARVTIVGYACACTPYTQHEAQGQRDHEQARRGSGKTGWHADDKRGTPKISAWREYHFDGWNAPPTRRAVVLDPFVGTGTTIGVARALGRVGVGCDLSRDYLRLARWRVFQSGHFNKSVAATIRDRQGTLL